jgi:hypothetical protein
MQLVAGPTGTVAEVLLGLSVSDRGKLMLSCHQYPPALDGPVVWSSVALERPSCSITSFYAATGKA